jgi:hypothetical protein
MTNAVADPALQHVSRKSATGVLPLPLAPFERYLLTDDSPDYPMQFFCRLRFSGRLLREPLTEALRSALDRHPLLEAVLRQTGKIAMHWVAAEAATSVLRWIDGEPGEELPASRSIDIRSEPGVRLTAVVGQTHSDLVVQFHHAATDALGAFDFLGDLLTIYANLLSGENRHRLKPLDADRLRGRASLGLGVRALLRRAGGDLGALLRSKRFYKRRPAPLAAPQLDRHAPLPRDYPQCRLHRFARDESVRIARMASASEASVNSLLARDLFLTFRDWCREKGCASSGDWFRIVVPVSMRDVGDRRMPAANRVSMTFLDRQIPDGQDEDRLLNEILEEMRIVKRDARALRLLLVLGALQWFPWILTKGLRRRRPWATALLTNVGAALSNCHLPRADGKLLVGDMTLEGVDMAPIIRACEPVSFAVSTYAGRLTLGMHFDPRTISAADAEALLGLYAARIRKSIVASKV